MAERLAAPRVTPASKFRLETAWVGMGLFVCVTLFISACVKNPTTPAGSGSCTYTNSPTSVNVGASGGTSTVAVTVSGSSCSWTATSNAAFITVTSGSSGTGNGTVALTIAANTDAARSGTVTIAGQTVTINQDAAPAVVCTYTLSSTVVSATAAGGTSTVTVIAPSTCSWTTTSNAAFMTVTSGTSGMGNGTVTLTIAANAGSARSGTVTVAGQTVTVNQDAAAPVACTYTLSTTTVSAAAAGGSSTVTVTAPSTCGWTAVSNAVFITIPSGTSGTGNGTVTLAIAANSGAARSGTVTIAGQTVTVNQGGPGVVASFVLFNPSVQAAPTTDCQFRSATGQPTTCTLQSTSFTLGANAIVSYTWTVQYTYVTVKTLTQSGSSPSFSFTDVCGLLSSTADGAARPLSVQLTVVDNLGATATVNSGTGNQPPLQVRLYSCGTPPPSPATVSIVPGASTMTTTAYSPNPLNITRGTTVTWINNDTSTHNNVADGGAFNTGDIAPGSQASFTFQNAGAFPYHCGLHPGMVATVNVQ